VTSSSELPDSSVTKLGTSTHSVKESPGLVRALGLGAAIAIVVGNVIGAGIFLKPRAIAINCGEFPLIISGWILAGIVCMFGALCFAELASMLPHAGGLYVFLREAYGKCVAFLFGLNEFVFGRTATNGALATAFSVMSISLITGSRDVDVDPWLSAVVACGTIGLLAAINMIGVAWGGRVQSSTTLVKAGFLGMIALLPFLLALGDHASLKLSNYGSSVAQPALTTVSAQFAAIFMAVMWAYNGWHDIAPVAEEVRDPQRNIPRSLIWGTGIIMVLYVSTNLAYHGALTMTQIAEGDENTAILMIRTVLEPYGSNWSRLGVASVSAVAICSVFGALNCNLMLGPRIAFAMARDGIFWRPLANVHPTFRTPAVAILTQGTVSCCFVLVVTYLVVTVESLKNLKVFDLLTNFVVYSANIFYALCILAVFILRIRHPEWHRPYRTWGYPIVPAFYLAVMGWFLTAAYFAQPYESKVALCLVLLGLPLYALNQWWNRKTGLPANTSGGEGTGF
jgi:APA family basic amino acid/polyamine antiporter